MTCRPECTKKTPGGNAGRAQSFWKLRFGGGRWGLGFGWRPDLRLPHTDEQLKAASQAGGAPARVPTWEMQNDAPRGGQGDGPG